MYGVENEKGVYTMTTINPVTATQSQATAFKGKKSLAQMVDKLSKKELLPLEIVDKMNSPISRAVREGRPKEEIREMLIRDAATIAVYQMAEKKAAEIAKQAAKNAYKK